ncbi:MAG: hypothetical protein AAFX79_13755, partial [Planctomycetota bacterium]
MQARGGLVEHEQAAGVGGHVLLDALARRGLGGLRGFGQFGQYYAGDGENYRAGLQGGVGLGESGFLVGTFEYFDAARTSRSRQRADAIAFQEANPDIAVPV